jgi:hypothetical protein
MAVHITYIIIQGSRLTQIYLPLILLSTAWCNIYKQLTNAILMKTLTEIPKV